MKQFFRTLYDRVCRIDSSLRLKTEVRNDTGTLSCATLILLALCSMPLAKAQSLRSLINDGNGKYKKEKYADAEINYRKALEKDKKEPYGNYNLGDALFKQQKLDEALQQFQDAAEKATDDNIKSNAYYNLGNTLVGSKRYPEAIASYKNSLKLDPNNADAKYNLSYAMKMLQQEQQKQKDEQNKENKDQNKQDKKDQKQQQQQDQKSDEQQKKEKQEQQNQQQQNQEAKQDQTKQQQAKQQQAKQEQDKKMKKEQAEAILNQLKNNEKKIQKQLKKQPGQDVKVDKDW